MQLPRFDDLLLVGMPALAILWTWWYYLRIRRGKRFALRPLAASTALETHLGEVLESGRPVHIATGTGQPGAVGVTAESLAGLLLAERVAGLTTQRGGTVVGTSGDAVVHTALRGTLRRAHQASGLGLQYRSAQAQLVAHQTPIAYAAGVVQRYEAEPIDMGVVIGDGGAETLLIGEEGARHRITQIAGATSLSALPVLALSANATLVGEEVWAAEAYLTESPTAQARLRTQDALRWLVGLLIVAGVVYGVLNTTLNLGLPAL